MRNPVVDTVGSGFLKASAYRRHWPVGIVLAIAAVLVLTRLGQDYLWEDEGDTAVFAANIVKDGLPTAWDGTALIDSDLGNRLNDSLVMVSHPWLQYYLTAASFVAFGQTPWAARFPFALLGLATIALTYVLVWQATRNRWTAAAAAGLLTVSVQFLLYSRQSRYYTLSAALTCLLVWLFLRLRSWKSATAFAAIAALNFHSHPIGIAPVGAMGLLTLTSGPFRESRRWFWMAMPAVILVTAPWLWIASGGYSEATTFIEHAWQFLPRLGQFAIECGSVTSLPAVAVIVAVLAWRSRRPVFSPDERRLAVVLAVTVAGFALVMAVTQSRETIWTTGVRYTPAVLPFGVMLAAITMARVANGRRSLAVALILVLAFTKFGRLTPWTFSFPSIVLRDQTASVSFHNPERTIDRVLRTGQLAFVQSIGQPNVGTTGRIVEYLQAHAQPGDIVLTNYAWEPLYFHTRLPLAMTVLSSYPIYQAAKARGLPDYVFRANDARWIVWRKAWGSYRGQSIDQVLARLGEERMQATPVITLQETLWENRENLHFRRFANGRYIYPWHDEVPATVIYRVEEAGPRSPGTGGRPSTH